MILDGSVVVAILLREAGWRALVDRLGGAGLIGIGAPTLAETGIVLTARIGDRALTAPARFLPETGLTVIPFGEEHWRAALDAYRRFGRG